VTVPHQPAPAALPPATNSNGNAEAHAHVNGNVNGHGTNGSNGEHGGR